MLTCRWSPGDAANAVETKQAKFGAEPEIPIRGLRHRENGADGEPVADGPRLVPVLADVESWVQREAANAARRECAEQDGNSSRSRHS